MTTLETLLTEDIDVVTAIAQSCIVTTDATANDATAELSSPPLNTARLIELYYKDVPAGDFTLTDIQLGQGGFATVVEVAVTDKPVQLDKDTKYVLKKTRCATLVPSARDRVKLEAAISRSLSHCPYIHKSVGGIFKNGCNGILMERGTETLRAVAVRFGELEMSGQLVPESRATYYVLVTHAMLAVVAALEAMHAAQMIHCDVKPSNMIVTQPDFSGSVLPHITLADFGSTQLVTDVKKPQEVKKLSGTPFYMAPESLSMPRKVTDACTKSLDTAQLRLRPSVSRATDVWSLGVSLLELLNFGQNPIAAHFGTHDAYVAQLLPATCEMTKTTAGTFTTGRSLADAAFNFAVTSTAPTELVALAQKCLVLSRTERPGLRQVRQALEAFLTGNSVTAGVCQPTRYTVNVAPQRTRANTVSQETIALQEMVLNLERENRRLVECLGCQMERLFASPEMAAEADTSNNDDAAFDLRMLDGLTRGPARQQLLNASQPTAETHDGRVVYKGPRGGRFWLDDKNLPHYLPRVSTRPVSQASSAVAASAAARTATARAVPQATPTGQTYQSSGSANGRTLYEGSRGGQFYVTDSGNRRYVSDSSSGNTTGYESYSAPAPQRTTYSATPTGQTYQSSGSANGRTLYEGSRGGQFYVTDSGNRRYI